VPGRPLASKTVQSGVLMQMPFVETKDAGRRCGGGRGRRASGVI
jgi:hypothetical protein